MRVLHSPAAVSSVIGWTNKPLAMEGWEGVHYGNESEDLPCVISSRMPRGKVRERVLGSIVIVSVRSIPILAGKLTTARTVNLIV